MEKLSLLRNDLTSKRADITRDLEKFKAVSGNNGLVCHDLLIKKNPAGHYHCLYNTRGRINRNNE